MAQNITDTNQNLAEIKTAFEDGYNGKPAAQKLEDIGYLLQLIDTLRGPKFDEAVEDAVKQAIAIIKQRNASQIIIPQAVFKRVRGHG